MTRISRPTFTAAVLAIVVCFLGPDISMASDPAIHQTQQKLKELGYDPGTVDGLWGSKTKDALKQYQKDQGIEATGKLDETTRKQLGVTDVPAKPTKKASTRKQPSLPAVLYDIPTNEQISTAEKQGCSYYWIIDKAILTCQ